MCGVSRMYKFGKGLVRAALLSAAAICSTNASAGTILATLNSFGQGDTITLHAVRPNGSTIAAQVLNGRSVFTRTGGTDTAMLAGSGTPGSFYAFCIEPFEDAALNANYAFTLSAVANADSSSIPGGLGSLKSTRIGELFGQFSPNLAAAAMTQVQASALQLALWEIVSETSNVYDVATGSTYFSTPASSDFNDVMGLAQTYLNYVTSTNGTGVQAQGLQALAINGNQDFLVQVVSTAPEPGTWLMMLIGFGLIGGIARRRGTQHTPAVRQAV